MGDFGISLTLSHTVVGIVGRDKLEAVEIAPVDAITLKPDLSRKFTIECDCLLLSVGLIQLSAYVLSAGGVTSPKTKLIEVDHERRAALNLFAVGNCL